MKGFFEYVRYGALAVALAGVPVLAQTGQGSSNPYNNPSGTSATPQSGTAQQPGTTTPGTTPDTANPSTNPAAPGYNNPTTNDNTNRGVHNFGWIGLIGVAGLIGLVRRNHPHTIDDRTNMRTDDRGLRP